MLDWYWKLMSAISDRAERAESISGLAGWVILFMICGFPCILYAWIAYPFMSPEERAEERAKLDEARAKGAAEAERRALLRGTRR